MKDLVIKNIATDLVSTSKEYSLMLKNIDEKFPAVARDSSNFYKSHSQFMNVTVDVTALTPIRAIKNTLAEIDRTKSALQFNYFELKKKEVEINRKRHQLENDSSLDEFDKELLCLEIAEHEAGLASSQNVMNGAIRKLNFFVNQHESLMKKIGKEFLTEEDYEREEARYHIMTCMKQALNASRSRNGMIDEGNFIYIFELGINAAEAQAEVYSYLKFENEMISNGSPPTHEMTMKWLEKCADQWEDCPRKFAEGRGFQILDTSSLANHIYTKDKF